MAKYRGQAQITLIDLNDAKQLVSYITASLQRQTIYNPNTGIYLPNYSSTPQVLTPQLFIAGKNEDISEQAVAVRWYYQENSNGKPVEILGNTDTYELSETMPTTLTIKRNIFEGATSMNYIVEIDYIDTETESSLVVTSKSMIDLVKINNGTNGSDGENVSTMILTNESHTVSTDTDGTGGNYENANTEVIVYNGNRIDTDNWIINTTTSEGVVGTWNDDTKTYQVNDMTVDNGTVTFIAEQNGKADIKKVYSISKAKQGQGKDAISTWIIVDSNLIYQDNLGNYDRTSINVQGKAQVGTNPIADYAGRFKVYESTDGRRFLLKYTSEEDETNIDYVFNAGIKAIKIEFYQAGGTDNIIDSEQITVLVQPDDLISAYITNENAIIPTRNDGTGGNYSEANTRFVLLRGKTDISEEEGWTFEAAPSEGVIGSFENMVYTVTDMTTDTGYIDISASKEHYATLTKRFSLVKNKKALDGVSATAIWGILSDQVITRNKEGILSPNTLSVSSFSQTGSEETAEYEGRFIILETTDDNEWIEKYRSTENESTKQYVISSKDVKAVKFEIYKNDGLTKVDELTARVLSEGANGADGINTFLHTAWSNVGTFPFFVEGARLNVLKQPEKITAVSNNASTYPNDGYWVTDEADGRVFFRTMRKNFDLNPTKFSIYNSIGVTYDETDPINKGDLTVPIVGRKVVISGEFRGSREAEMVMMAKAVVGGVSKGIKRDAEKVTVGTDWKVFSTVVDSVEEGTTTFRFLPSSDTNGWDTAEGFYLDQKNIKVEIVEEGESEEPTPWVPPITRGLFNPTNMFQGGNTRFPTGYGGATVSVTENVEIPEWGATDAYTVKTTGGTSAIKATLGIKQTGSTQSGSYYYSSNFHIRNNHETSNLNVYSNGGTSVSVPPKTIGYLGTPAYQQVPTANLQFTFQTADVNTEADFTMWNPEFYVYDVDHGFNDVQSETSSYFGSYVDQNKKNSQNPADYSWKLLKGNDGISVILSNESEIIPTDNNGENGVYTNAQTEMLVYEGTKDVTENWSFSAINSNGVTGRFADKVNKYIVTNMTVDSGYVDLTASRRGYSSVTRRFSVNKNRKALDGQDALSCWGNVSNQVIARQVDGNLSPSEVVITSNSQQGTNGIEPYLGRIKVYESIDNGTTWTLRYTSSTDEAEKHFSLENKLITNFKVEFYLAGSLEDKYDEITGVIVKDGESGQSGQDAYNIILSNESVVIATDPNGNNGVYTNAVSTVSIYKGVTEDTANWNLSVDKSATITGSLTESTYTVTNMTSDSGYVRFIASKDEKTLVKDFTLVKNKKATDGQDSVSYWLITGSSVIKKDGNGLLNPESINITSHSQKGIESVQEYAGYFTIEESINNGEWVLQYSSLNGESIKVYKPTTNTISGIRIRLFYEKEQKNLLDEQIISVVSDGSNPILTILSTPEGNTVKNDDGAVIIVSETYQGSNMVIPDSLRWFISKDGVTDPTAGAGWEEVTTSSETIIMQDNTLTVVASEITNVLGIKSIIQYNSLTRQATTSIVDVSDPLQLQIIGSGTFKNGTGSNTYIARVYQAGMEVDSDGSRGTYTWSLRDKDNNQISGWTKTGKQVTLDAKDFVSNAVVICQVDFN